MLQKLLILVQRLPIAQLARFGTVGLLNTAVDLSIWSALTYFGKVDYVTANVISYSCAAVNSFIFNRTWTFSKRKRDRSMFLQAGMFALVTALGIATSSAVIFVFSPVIGGLLSKVMSIAIVFSATFVLNKRFTFRA